jgi:hypothetical protein
MTRWRRGWAKHPFLPWTAVVLAAACTHKVASDNGSDGGSLDGGVCAEESGCDEDGGGVDAFVVDTGWVCPLIPESNAGADCDTCVQDHCDAVWCTCAQDTGTSDGGVSACLASLACLASCPADGGDGGACAGCSPGSFTQAEQQQAQALSSCMAQSCATQCPGAADVFL